jgi:hypothetical protein
MLYAYTVLCQVYQLRSENGKLTREQVRATLRIATLRYARFSKIGAPEEFASIHDGNGVELDRITCATIRFIRDGGIMIRGFEIVEYPGPRRMFTQAWWCVPQPARMD